MADAVGVDPSFALARDTFGFNLAPAGYLHETWFTNLPHGDVCQTLSAYPRAQGQLSRYLLGTLKLDTRFFHDFSEPRARLALLDGKLLESLFLYVGAALRANEFRNVLDGARIADLRRALGNGPLDYAIKRGSFSGTLPQFPYEPKLRDPRLRLLQIGAVYSVSPRAAADPAYLGRLALKLPHRLSAGLVADLPAEAGEPDRTGLPPITHRVVKEFMPKWLPIFA